MLNRWLLYVGSVLLGLAVVGGLLLAFVLALLYPTLPSLESLTDYQPKIPLRIVSAEGDLLGEFGEERRAIVTIAEVPDVMKKAILAAEDERFYSHGGVDYLSVLRAAASNVTTGTQQGRRHDHHAGRPQFLPHPRKDNYPEAAGSPAGLENRGQPRQGRHPPALRKPDLSGPAGLRLRGSLPDLFRQAPAGGDGRRGRHAGRAAQGAVRLQSGEQPQPGQDPPALCPSAYA